LRNIRKCIIGTTDKRVPIVPFVKRVFFPTVTWEFSPARKLSAESENLCLGRRERACGKTMSGVCGDPERANMDLVYSERSLKIVS
jgi:hypothetical protein